MSKIHAAYKLCIIVCQSFYRNANSDLGFASRGLNFYINICLFCYFIKSKVFLDW
jgi:hypothetical protein